MSDAGTADVTAKDEAAVAAALAGAVAGAGDAGTAAERGRGRWARWRSNTTGGAPFYPLAMLFLLEGVDELDRTAFGILAPEIRDHFGLDDAGFLALFAGAQIAALVLALPFGFLADRVRRVPIALGGAATWGVFSVLTGLATHIAVLGVARSGAGLGRAVNNPVHNSLLADYYDIPVRPRVYAVHRYANALGQFIGPLAAGLMAFALGWRTPFVVYGVVTAIVLVLALRLREPVRGWYERRAMGASAAVLETEEQSPSWVESWRTVWQVRSLRRIYYALPFLAIAVFGLVTLGALYYEDVFDLDERARGFLAAGLLGPVHLAGLMVAIPLATKLLARGAGHVLRFLAVVSGVVAAAWVVFALAPNLGVAIAANAVLEGSFFLLVPGIFAVLSLAIPAKVRSFGYAVGALWVLPGLVLLPVVGSVADAHGIRVGLLVAAPIFMIGGFVLASGGRFVAHDIAQVWKSTAARSEVAHMRREGQVKLLLARGIDVHYDNVQVLFGVDFEVDEGEVVALLGTNGAGKSTLLRAMSGQVQPSAGAVVLDGRDMTHTPPNEVAGRGVSQVPGGQGVFTQLSVADNLRLAGWQQRRRPAEARAAIERVLDIFPQLRVRLSEPAGNLSGGQQQMLTLGMAFVAKPRLLMIDELSLGLAPVVIAQLLDMVRALRDQGVTIILVEQSVNVALTVAERAYFMEKGEIRFEGPTADLLARPDLLRSVFLSADTAGTAGAGSVNETGWSATLQPDPAPGPTWPRLRRERHGRDAHTSGTTPSVHTSGTGETADGGDGGAPVVLEVRGVGRSFGGVRALDDVGFDVRAGEIVGFIGPNGAGKTTLFDVVSGFLPAHTGTIRLRWGQGMHDLHGTPAHTRSWRGLGRSFQDGRLFPGLTVAEAVAVALEQHVEVRDPLAASLHLPSVDDSEAAVRRRVDELVDLLGLGAYRDKFVRELSTGTRRVVDLACVFAQDPAVVLLDEPSSGIAQREAEALGPLLRRVRDDLGASLLVIEHDLPLLRSLADRMIALDLGRVVAEGPPSEVIEHPAVVASYLGTDEAAIARSGSAVT